VLPPPILSIPFILSEKAEGQPMFR